MVRTGRSPALGGMSPQRIMDTSNRPTPICGILSVTLTPLALLFAFLASLLVEALMGRAPHAVARTIVFLSLSCILAGVVFGVVGLARRERPRWLPVIGWLSTICTIGL